MKILFVALPYSIHTARWIAQLADQKWDIYLFPSVDSNSINSEMPTGIKVCIPYLLQNRKNASHAYFVQFIKKLIIKINPTYYEKRLIKYIKRIKPDIIHSMETQAAGYIVNIIKKAFKKSAFPIWWHTNWGSDIYLFGRLKDHKEKIRDVLNNCDYYSCECKRDAELARKFGFTKTILSMYPNTGGFNIEKISEIRKIVLPASQRKCIMLKGYQGWSGRSLVAIRAISLIGSKLDYYTILVYCCQSLDVKIALELLQENTGATVKIVEENTEHLQILNYHGMSRFSIGVGISDSISTSVLEAMAMGSFPIQSNTSSADEWFENGVSGFLVPPEDPGDIAVAISKALVDDILVDTAGKINWETISTRLEYNDIKQKTINSYNSIYSKGTKS